MEEPFVSVILPVFDRAGSVARSIESVLAQTHRALELIVVDDGSTDSTPAVLDRYRGVARILSQDRGGAYAARNLALRHARGELVAFIDSDDAWYPDKLALQLPLLARPEIGVVYGDIDIVTAPTKDAPRTGRTGFDAVAPRRGRVADAFVWGNFVPTCTALVRRSCLDEIGGFPEESRVSADYLAWFRIARRHEFDFVPAPVAAYTLHEDGISHDLGRSLAARIALFRGELEHTSDPEARRTLEQLLFNLGVHLALAAARGRARSVAKPLDLARSAAAAMDRRRILWSIAAFAANQVRRRARRFVS